MRMGTNLEGEEGEWREDKTRLMESRQDSNALYTRRIRMKKS